MTDAPFRFEPLSERHDRTAFQCGEAHSECVVRVRKKRNGCRVIPLSPLSALADWPWTSISNGVGLEN